MDPNPQPEPEPSQLHFECCGQDAGDALVCLEHGGSATSEPWRGASKTKMVRDYSLGSIRDHIARAESTEELDAIAKFLEDLVDQGKISNGSALKATKLGHKRYLYLQNRLVQPSAPQRLLVPKKPGEIQSPSGLILLK